MSQPLARLLRVRKLLEEISRAEYAQRNAAQAGWERQARAAWNAAGGALRAAAQTLQADESAPGLWPRYLADGETSQRRGRAAERAAAAEAEQVAAAREAFLAARRQRMQVEIVLAERAGREQRIQLRREQQAVDDWFGMRRARNGPAKETGRDG
jgi:hypothetical protein